MTVSRCRQLTAIILLIVVLLAPLTSIAHDYSGAIQDTCACQILPGDNGNSPPPPGNAGGGGDCCDHEECCSDAMEPATNTDIVACQFQKEPFLLNLDNRIREVYLAIFVPPES